MLKLVVLIIVILIVLFALKSFLRGAEAKRHGNDRGAAGGGAADGAAASTMVRCAQCGVHVPRGESIYSRSKFFCSEEHRLVHFK